jgi:hypothetical protein
MRYVDRLLFILTALAFMSSSALANGIPYGYSTTQPDALFAVMPTPNNEVQVGDWNTTALNIMGGLTTTGNVAAAGSVQVGQNSQACGGSGAAAGTIRWNTSSLAFEGCNGSSWQPIGGGGLTTVVGGCQTYWSSCPAGYRATSYFSPGTYNCCDRCGNPAWRYTVCSQ